MSKLGDVLIEMDRGRSRPRGFGQIAGLGERREAPRLWRLASLLVIVASVLAVPLAIPLRFPGALPKPAPAPASVETSARERPQGADGVRVLLDQAARRAELGEVLEAERLLRQALRLRPEDAEAWKHLGVILVKRGQPTAAAEAFQRAVRLDPDDLEAHRNLGIARDREGRRADAVTAYRTFLRLSPADDPGRDEVRRRLGEISGVRGDR